MNGLLQLISGFDVQYVCGKIDEDPKINMLDLALGKIRVGSWVFEFHFGFSEMGHARIFASEHTHMPWWAVPGETLRKKPQRALCTLWQCKFMLSLNCTRGAHEICKRTIGRFDGTASHAFPLRD